MIAARKQHYLRITSFMQGERVRKTVFRFSPAELLWKGSSVSIKLCYPAI